jgi:hypothetical protein
LPLPGFPWEISLTVEGVEKRNALIGRAKTQIWHGVWQPRYAKSPGAAAPAPFTKGGPERRMSASPLLARFLCCWSCGAFGVGFRVRCCCPLLFPTEIPEEPSIMYTCYAMTHNIQAPPPLPTAELIPLPLPKATLTPPPLPMAARTPPPLSKTPTAQCNASWNTWNIRQTIRNLFHSLYGIIIVILGIACAGLLIWFVFTSLKFIKKLGVWVYSIWYQLILLGMDRVPS